MSFLISEGTGKAMVMRRGEPNSYMAVDATGEYYWSMWRRFGIVFPNKEVATDRMAGWVGDKEMDIAIFHPKVATE